MRVILFTNARDEMRIREWAAHHLLLGFSLIYIFDHKSRIPLKRVFHGFDKRVLVERCELNGAIKMPLMNRATAIANYFKADWMIYLDADEFICLNSFLGVKRMLLHYPFADSVALNWLLFGTNNHVTEPKDLILNSYTKSEATLDQHVKTFVRPSQIKMATNPHFYQMRNPYRMYSVTKERINVLEPQFHKNRMNYQQAPAFIAHYIHQSEETYIRRKLNLPMDDTNTFRSKDLEIHNKYNSVENTCLKEKYGRIVNQFLEQYRK